MKTILSEPQVNRSHWKGNADVEEMETLEKGLVVAGLEALRQTGGDALVMILLDKAENEEFAQVETMPERVPIEDYLRYRDSALEFLQDSFCMTAFQTGQIIVRSLDKEKLSQISKLIDRYRYARSKLPVIGQAAVLSAKENPGVVRATMKSDFLLSIIIENCPECRNLQREAPFCYLNQGVITEFAERFLDVQVITEETRCIALGDPVCEIEVKLTQ